MPTTEPARNQPTPRTDAAIVKSILCTEGGDEECTVYPVVEHVEADFARILECEIAALTAKLALAERDSKHGHHILAKCFVHLGQEIHCKRLNESAHDGTQSLHKEIAQFLDAAMQPEGGK